MKVSASYFVIAPLCSQIDTYLQWHEVKYVILGDQGSAAAAMEWGDALALETGKSSANDHSIASVVSIPPWLSRSSISRGIVKRAIRTISSSYPLFLDWSACLATANSVSTYPTVLRISSDMKIEERCSGPMEEHVLQQIVDSYESKLNPKQSLAPSKPWLRALLRKVAAIGPHRPEIGPYELLSDDANSPLWEEDWLISGGALLL